MKYYIKWHAKSESFSVRWRMPVHIFWHVPYCFMFICKDWKKGIKPTHFLLFTVTLHVCPTEADIWRQLRGMDTSSYLCWPENLGQLQDTRRIAKNPEFTRTQLDESGPILHLLDMVMFKKAHVHDGFTLLFSWIFAQIACPVALRYKHTQ